MFIFIRSIILEGLAQSNDLYSCKRYIGAQKMPENLISGIKLVAGVGFEPTLD